MGKVLFLNPYYYPGFRSGGPQQTVMNIVDIYGVDNDIYILTQNCDLGLNDSYNVEIRKWVRVGNANVMYLPPKEYNISSIRKISRDFETVYACGLFDGSTIDAILIHKLRKTQKLYIASMGVFSKSAITSKAIKKKIFLFVFKHFGLFKDLIWSVTSEMELAEAKDALGQTLKKYIIAEDLPRKIDFNAKLEKIYYSKMGQDEPLKLVFVSRISPKKNLEYCAEILGNIHDTKVFFDVYGTIEDKKYWEKCRIRLENLPSNIIYRYCGEINSDDVINTFSRYDAFLFPTKGENFGHVIYEALAAGCVPIISNETPWRDLDICGCGYIVPLQITHDFVAVVKDLKKKKEHGELRGMKEKAVGYAKKKYEYSVNTSGYINVFQE